MAFFGVEVRSAKPFTYSSDKVKGRLRISQATLGVGSPTKKTLVQCTVGDKSPVFLCVLIPDKTESCQLDLEFDEAEDVVFSVIGPRSVYLTGYYLSNGRNCNVTSDTESYGEDIGNTESEKSIHSADEDEYDDSFINDDEPEVVPDSPVSSDGDDLEILEDDLPKSKKGNPKRLKKRYQVIESDEETSLEDSEDDDKYLLSVFKTKRSAKNASSKSGENANKLAAVTSGETEITACGDSGLRKEDEAKKKGSDNIKLNDNFQTMPANDVKDQERTLENEMASANCEKPKKKRKERSKDVEICETESSNHQKVKAERTEAETGNTHQDLMIKHKMQKPITDMDIDDHPAELGSEKSGPKSKKRRKTLERESVKGDHEKSQDVKEKHCNEDIVKAANNGKDVPATEEDQIRCNNISNEINPALVADGCLAEKKTKTKKNKKSKTQANGEDKVLMKSEDKHLDAVPSEVRTLSNGLIIEELAKGEPNGKLAAPGKKVKVYYTAKLKENGHVFDSNIGKSPYRFRLGGEEIIEGWNLGLDGMRVGDKRRLIIPPSMGYGSQGTGENVPPNSWLLYEVELVDVRK